MTSAAPLTREALRGAKVRILKRGRRAKPDVLRVEGEEGPFVVKDYAPRGFLVRRWLGPWLARREQRVHAALAGVPAVPRLIGRIDPLAFAIEYREGRPLSRALAAGAGSEPVRRFLGQLEATIDAMHAAGVVHLDLRHRSNVLMDASGRPVVVDFAGAMCFRPGGFWYRWYRPTALWRDHRALAKWRRRLVAGQR